MISERAPLEIYIFPCLRKYPARRTARGRSDQGKGLGGGGGVVPGQGMFCIWSLKKKQFLVHVLGQRLLEYDFLQIAGGKTITSSFKHAVSDTFIIMISERAPLEIYIFPCLRKYPARRTARERSDRAGGCLGLGLGCLPRAGDILHLEPEKP